jgi:hypothetical protein
MRICIPLLFLFLIQAIQAQHHFKQGECHRFGCYDAFTGSPDKLYEDYQDCIEVLNDSVFVQTRSVNDYFKDTFKVIDEVWYRMEEGHFYLYFSKEVFDRGDSIKHIVLGCDTVQGTDILFNNELMFAPLGKEEEVYIIKGHLISDGYNYSDWIWYFHPKKGLIRSEGDEWVYVRVEE